jgi:hypothetical protein
VTKQITAFHAKFSCKRDTPDERTHIHIHRTVIDFVCYEVRFPAGVEIYPPATTPHADCLCGPASLLPVGHCVAVYPGVKLLQREADRSPPPTADVSNQIKRNVTEADYVHFFKVVKHLFTLKQRENLRNNAEKRKESAEILTEFGVMEAKLLL